MTGRCATCAHYLPPDGIWDRYQDAWARGYGQCKVASSDGARPEAPGSLAVAMDHEGYTAWLLVRPDYGCVQWGGRADR